MPIQAIQSLIHQRSFNNSWTTPTHASQVPAGLIVDLVVVTPRPCTVLIGTLVVENGELSLNIVSDDYVPNTRTLIAELTTTQFGQPINVQSISNFSVNIVLGEAPSATIKLSDVPISNLCTAVRTPIAATPERRLRIVSDTFGDVDVILNTRYILLTDSNIDVSVAGNNCSIRLTTNGELFAKQPQTTSGTLQYPITAINNIAPNPAGDIYVNVSFDPTAAAGYDSGTPQLLDASLVDLENRLILKSSSMDPTATDIIESTFAASRTASDPYRPLDMAFNGVDIIESRLPEDLDIDPQFDITDSEVLT